MNIVLINGSPKGAAATSLFLCEKLAERLGRAHETHILSLPRPTVSDEAVARMQGADVLVFAFPLYVDGIPSHLLRLLTVLEDRLRDRDIAVYAAVNCGFYEGRQNANAIAILRHWCHSTGLAWGQALGIGGGEMIAFNKNVPLGQGPMKNLGEGFDLLIAGIEGRQSSEDRMLLPNFPRPAYIAAAKFGKWRSMAKKNGLSSRDLDRHAPGIK